ncbi:MAG: hypothetical protein ACRDD1_05710, partial [Planctomycetia bacterium]
MARKKASTTPAEPAVEKTGGVNREVADRIDLEPWAWHLATWRPRTPLPRPEPPPFDKEACLERLRKLKTPTYLWEWPLEKCRVPPVMTPAEAEFWLTVVAWMTSISDQVYTHEKLTAHLDQQTFAGGLDRGSPLLALPSRRGIPPEFWSAVASALPADELIEYFAEIARINESPIHYYPNFRLNVLQRVLVYLSNDEFARLRERLQADFDPNESWQTTPPYHVQPRFRTQLLALLGAYREIESSVASWSKSSTAGGPPVATHVGAGIVFGLESADAVRAAFRTYELVLTDADDVRGWIAHTEAADLSKIRDLIVGAQQKERCGELLEVLACVKTPAVAPVMLDLKMNAKDGAHARKWLDTEVGTAIAGLMPTATGKGKLADAALAYLRDRKRLGDGDLIAKLAESQPAEVADFIRREVLEREEKNYEPLDDAATPTELAVLVRMHEKTLQAWRKKKNKPSWLDAALLPPVLVGGRRLADEQLETLVAVLSTVKADEERDPLVEWVRANAQRASVDGFAWHLFESWQEAGSESKENWCL